MPHLIPMPSKNISALCLLLALIFATLAAPGDVKAKGVACDFYYIKDIPDGWEIILPPGFNQRKSSFGYYANKEKDCSVMVQVLGTQKYSSLDEATQQTIDNLSQNGGTILKGPIRQGQLSRLEVTLTGTPSTMWIGTDGDVIALTVISGDRKECQSFLIQFHASPQLLPSADQVFMP